MSSIPPLSPPPPPPPSTTSPNQNNKRMATTVDDGNNDSTPESRQRKFFPRLKTLLSDEYEDFLRQIIEIVESKNCAAFPMATADTPWNDAFEAIYKTVASEYALPQGKNRLHKFKEKMVELWSAMQGEVTLGVKSDAHPIYRMALKQWHTHQSVMKDKKGPAFGDPGLDVSEDASDIMDPDAARPRKKNRSSINDLRRSGGGVDSDLSTSHLLALGVGNAPTPGEMMDSWARSLSRLENMLTASGLLQPKLPSPLYELHRLKTQMVPAEFDAKVRGPYEIEIGRHLAHVSAQCRTTSQPGLLPQLLEGLEVLRQSPQSSSVRKSLDYTHKNVLNKYLRLIAREDPLKAAPETPSPSQPPHPVIGADMAHADPSILEPHSVGDEEMKSESV